MATSSSGGAGGGAGANAGIPAAQPGYALRQPLKGLKMPKVVTDKYAPPPIKLSWKTKLIKMFSRDKSKAAKRAENKDIATRLQRDEAHRLIKRRIEELDLDTFWLNVRVDELYTWSLRELRIACAQRGLPQDGLKPTLVDRLMKMAWQDRKRVERDRIMESLLDQREGEASGTVYCFGLGYGEEYQSHDRPFLRNTLTIMTKLSGRGVHQVVAGMDATLCYAVCENGDVWVWGEVRPDEMSPLGFVRPLVYNTDAKERERLFRSDYRFARPQLAGNDRIGHKPKPRPPFQNKARKPGRPTIHVEGKLEEDDIDSDDSEAEERKRLEILEEVLAEMHDPYFISPTVISKLRGEGVVSIAASRTHAMALTDGGDVFTWGASEAGMLGIGAVDQYQEEPKLVKAIDATRPVAQIGTGSNHSVAVTVEGEVMVWGHSGQGRLGLGDVTSSGPQCKPQGSRHGEPFKGDSVSVTLPVPITSLYAKRRFVRQLACGSQHCVALLHDSVVSWGCGDGGRLGHGDSTDRRVPTVIEGLKGKIVTQVAAACWHSAAIVQVPPQHAGGWVYTWGCGYAGQLGQGGCQVNPTPALVRKIPAMTTNVTYLSCGAYHNAALTTDGNCLTWGSNAGGCLGRPGSMRHKNADFDPDPGRVESLREYGIGEIASVTCGNRFTAICTLPYAQLPRHRVREMARLDLAREQESKRRAAKAAQEQSAAIAGMLDARRRKKVEALNVARPLCSACSECEGFVPSLFKPMSCDMCGHERKAHNRMRVLGNPKYGEDDEIVVSINGSDEEGGGEDGYSADEDY